jgi:hypothetical protein
MKFFVSVQQFSLKSSDLFDVNFLFHLEIRDRILQRLYVDFFLLQFPLYF